MLDLDSAGAKWECPRCKIFQVVSYMILASVGTPICPDCDEEMELTDPPVFVDTDGDFIITCDKKGLQCKQPK